MKYTIKNKIILKKILWIDFLLGFTMGILGLFFKKNLTTILGLITNLIITISSITLLYSIVAFILIKQKYNSIQLLQILIYANWIWTIISMILLFFHYKNATQFGLLFLILQIVIVGLLAYFEGNQLKKLKEIII